MIKQSTEVRLGHSTFGATAFTLVCGLLHETEKLRSLHYKVLLDACFLESEVGPVGGFFDAVEANWSHLEGLCSRDYSKLQFQWYQLGNALWLSSSSQSPVRAQLCRRMLLHLARVALFAGDATKEQLRTTLFEVTLQQKKPKHGSEGLTDPTIICQLIRGSHKVDIRTGDLAKANNRILLFSGDRENDRAVTLHDDDDSDSDEDDAMNIKKAAANPRNYTGELDCIFLDTLEHASVDHHELAAEVPNSKDAKILLILKVAVLFRVPEALTLAAALLNEELFPSDNVLNDVVSSSTDLSEEQYVYAVGSIVAAGNVELGHELLARFIIQKSAWPNYTFESSSVLALSASPPVFPRQFVPTALFTSPLSKEKLVKKRIRFKKDGSVLEGVIRAYNSASGYYEVIVNSSAVGSSKVQVESCHVRSIESVELGAGTLLQLKEQVDVLALLGAKTCLHGTDRPNLLDESFEDGAAASESKSEVVVQTIDQFPAPPASSPKTVARESPKLEIFPSPASQAAAPPVAASPIRPLVAVVPEESPVAASPPSNKVIPPLPRHSSPSVPPPLVPNLGKSSPVRAGVVEKHATTSSTRPVESPAGKGGNTIPSLISEKKSPLVQSFPSPGPVAEASKPATGGEPRLRSFSKSSSSSSASKKETLWTSSSLRTREALLLVEEFGESEEASTTNASQTSKSIQDVGRSKTESSRPSTPPQGTSAFKSSPSSSRSKPASPSPHKKPIANAHSSGSTRPLDKFFGAKPRMTGADSAIQPLKPAPSNIVPLVSLLDEDDRKAIAKRMKTHEVIDLTDD